ncbi:hypothetical protein HHI36_009228 [Cryptolaemus montrouzieri]|uniref:Uncharacterized protein n=1 Tax=Cryptolaemus montrouzieri TaxID=559131 RepID=A0ABD2MUT0_9CUCU
MAHRRRILLQNYYFQSEEAVYSVFAEEDDNAYDFMIVSPDPSAITDEEVGPEDDFVTQALSRDAPGTVEVVRRKRQSSDSDSSDNELLLTYALTSKRPQNDNAYDFLIVPPDRSAITDEEVGPEDNLVIQALPIDATGTAEVVRRKTQSSDGDISDDELLLTYASTSKRPGMSEAANAASGNPIWPKTLPIYCTPD